MKPSLRMGLLGLLATGVIGVYGSWFLRSAQTRTETDDHTPTSADAEITPSGPRPAPMLRPRSLSEGLYDMGHWRGKPELADLDADGRLDLVAALRRWDRDRPGEGVYVWLGDGNGRWRASLEGLRRDMGYGGASVGDVDGDGTLDLAYSGHDVAPRVFLGDGTGFWLESSEGIVASGTCSDVALGDVDGDGRDELVTVGFFPKNGGMFAFRRTGDAWERMAEVLPVAEYGSQARLLDLDGDGRDELVAATSIGPRVWTWSDGGFEELSTGFPTPEVGGSDLAVDARDLDGDGWSELLVAGMSYEGHAPLTLYRWDGETWSPWGSGLPDDEAFFDAEFADLDGEGPLEIVAAGKEGVSVIAMVAPGTFERVGRVEDTVGVINLTTGDVDGDGKEEVATVGFDGVRVLAIPYPGGRL